MAEVSLVNLPLDERHSTLLMIMEVNIGSVNAWRHQASTWANGDPDLYRHMALLGPNELNWLS